MLTFLNESLAAVKFFFLIAESDSFETPRLRYGNREPQRCTRISLPGRALCPFSQFRILCLPRLPKRAIWANKFETPAKRYRQFESYSLGHSVINYLSLY